MKLKVNDCVKVNYYDGIKPGTVLKVIDIVVNRLGGKMYKCIYNRKNATKNLYFYIDEIDNSLMEKIDYDDFTNVVGLVFCDNKNFILWNKENKKTYDRIKRYWKNH